jgi:hypothetical protein
VKIIVFKGEKVSLYSNMPCSPELKKCMYLSKKNSMLESAASTTLFPCGNQLRFIKEYFLQHRCFLVGVGLTMVQIGLLNYVEEIYVSL